MTHLNYVQQSNNSDILVLGIIGMIFLFIMLIAFVFYIIKSIAFYKMANKLKIENSWLSFIPIVQFYILGKIAQRKAKIKNLEIILPVTCILAVIVQIIANCIPIVGPIINIMVSLIYLAIFLYAYYYVYALFSKGNEVVLTIVSGVFQIVTPFIMLIISSNEIDISENPISLEK